MAEILPDGTKQNTLSKSQYSRLVSILQRFYQETRCRAAILTDSSGMLVAHAGRSEQGLLALLATLAAANYSATREMARLLSEQGGFKINFHEGRENNVYVAEAGEDFFLVIVFGAPTTFAMVRVLAKKSTKEILEVLREGQAGTEKKPHVSREAKRLGNDAFRDELSSRLDEVLKNKD